MQHFKIGRLPILLLTVLLVACGGNAAAPASTSAPVAAVPSVAPLVSTDAAPTNAAAPTAVSTDAAPTNAAAPTSESTGPFAGIAQGTTPEGYHMLGNPSAPALLVMYSDFL